VCCDIVVHQPSSDFQRGDSLRLSHCTGLVIIVRSRYAIPAVFINYCLSRLYQLHDYDRFVPLFVYRTETVWAKCVLFSTGSPYLYELVVGCVGRTRIRDHGP